MQQAIISDTSCLILLEKINELDILRQMFGKILITHEIAVEYDLTLPPWIEITKPKNNKFKLGLENSIDLGEASAIALALELENSLLIIDDLKGRKVAEFYGLKITGTLGILISAKLNGLIPSIKPILNKIKSTNFRISLALENEILVKCGENDTI